MRLVLERPDPGSYLALVEAARSLLRPTLLRPLREGEALAVEVEGAEGEPGEFLEAVRRLFRDPSADGSAVRVRGTGEGIASAEEEDEGRRLLLTAALLSLPLALDLSRIPSSPEALALLPPSVAASVPALPLERQGAALTVAVPSPDALQTLRPYARAVLRPVLAFPGDLRREVLRRYPAREFVLEGVDPDSPEAAPTVLSRLLSLAARSRATDLHLRLDRRALEVLLRIDGRLLPLLDISPDLGERVLVSLKVRAGLDPGDARRPQDGRITFSHDGSETDARVATLGTAGGQVAVLRLLGAAVSLTPEDLGLEAPQARALRAAAASPHGLILAAGPTGSGKTTTLYSLLRLVDRTSRHVLTIEDPVEYYLDRIVQVPVNPGAGVTFASALRAFLRLDPDVILVGEVRDRETAELLAQAALTGHLVLSTVHAQDTATAFYRLQELGISPSVLASITRAVVAQRLLRLLCPSCRLPRPITPEEAEAFRGEEVPPPEIVYTPRGCPDCLNTGFRGRTGAFEVLFPSPAFLDALARGDPPHALRDLARREGMQTLARSALKKAAEGKTSPQEALAAVGGPAVE